jgi:Trypsin-like peptidase domain
LRSGLGTGALASIALALVSFAAGASPPMKSFSPAGSLSARFSPVHRAVIYAKEGSRKLIDGRWNLSQSESKLGIALTADEKTQLMACTGEIVCEKPKDPDPGYEVPPAPVIASAESVLRPDLLVTAKHVFFKGKRAIVPFGQCSFRSFLHRKIAVPVRVDQDQRRGYIFNNEDFIVVRLKRELKDCRSFALNDSESSLPKGEQIFSVTAHQIRTLNRLSRREPVIAKGTIRNTFDGFFGGPPFYHADIDFDIGGSGGAVFALKDGRPVSADDGRLILRGIAVGYTLNAKNGRPYDDEKNYTIVIGLEADFRELAEGKALKPVAVEPAPCWRDNGAAEIDLVSGPVPSSQSDTLGSSLMQFCREASPDGKTGAAKANCSELAKGLSLAAARPAKEKHEFTFKNDTSCPICFTYHRCNDYGCWDEAVTVDGNSTRSAGVGQRAPKIKNPQFCKSGRAEMGPPLPPRKPVLANLTAPDTSVQSSPPRPAKTPEHRPSAAGQHGVEPGARFLAAKEKAEREGVHTLTSDDIRGLSLDQIRALRGY